MSDPLDLTGIRGLDPSLPDTCTLEATLVTGFEPTAAEELLEKMGLTANMSRGRIVFDIAVDRVKEVLSLRCVNTVYLLVGHSSNYQYSGSQDEQMTGICEFVADRVDWAKGMRVWAQVMGFKGEIHTEKKSPVESSAGPEDGAVSSGPSFRATCYRTGEKSRHSFPSTLVASTIGGHIQDMFGWRASMKGYDLEFVINCDPDQLHCAITLNHSSLGNRTITEYGLCTLRPTIAASLARLAQLQPGDVVLDPMAGTGAISLEGSLGFPSTFHLAGELVKKSVRSCRVNLDSLTTVQGVATAPAMDVLQWDCILNPALRDNSVDVIISDLPFGKRSGNKYDNRKLYPDMLVSMARLVRPDTGRAVLLTQDKKNMFHSLTKTRAFWTHSKHITTNIGGLTALVFVLTRTSQSPP